MILFPEIADGEDKSSPLKNRIRNNYRHVRKWAKRTETNCFRIYDHEIKEYPLAIDYYDGRYCLHYFSYSREEEEPRADLIEAAESALFSLFKVKPDDLYWRARIRRQRAEQYEKIGKSKDFFIVQEYGVRFWVNLIDYLDTGLFLDHRESRRLVASLAKGKRVLNLFSYTGAFSVHAAKEGALFTKSVDMSNTYCDWARDNLTLNELSLNDHQVVRADCLKFLEGENERYDVIVIDPPTISRSKKMEGMFDIQRDYIYIIDKCLKLLNPKGTIFFSTNFRKFRFDDSLFEGCNIQEITEKTIPLDFHDQKIHCSWKIRIE